MKRSGADKRSVESDHAHTARTRCKALLHAARRARWLGPAYGRGSTHYAAAYYGKTVGPVDIQRMIVEAHTPLANVADTAA